MDRIELYVRLGASLGCFLGVGYGVYDIMQTYDQTFMEAISNSARTIPNMTKAEFWLMGRDTLAGLGAGGLAGGLLAKLIDVISERRTK